VAVLLPLAAHADPDPQPHIIVVKQSGVRVYQEVADQFRESCRVHARILDLAPGERPSLQANDVVLAVGQHALDAVQSSPARVVAALALRVPPGVLVADAAPPPELSLRALKAARPSVKRVAVVFGPRTEPLVDKMAEPARTLGLSLVKLRAVDGPSAVRELSRVQAEVDALWLAPDLEVLAPQVFRYALVLQLRRSLPLVAVSRQQVKAGALLAVDAEPGAVGRQAAALVNELLAGVPAQALREAEQTGTLEVVVNAGMARRLGADVAALQAIGARVE
jgi:hypothetical protein